MNVKYGKLVRDKQPEIIKADGWEPIHHQLNYDQRFYFLVAKLIEEASELVTGSIIGSHEDMLNELADIVEVVYAIGAFQAIGPTQIEDARRSKAERKGVFDLGIYLEEIQSEGG